MKPSTHGQLGVTRGSRGELIVTTTYRNWMGYSVSIEADGAIRVKQGDWLSKYSAAMYNNFRGIHEFARMGRDGRLHRIQNPNLIRTGETLYHIPTYKHAHPMRMDALAFVASPLSEDQTKKAVVETLKADFDLKGEQLHVVEEAIHILHGVDTAVQIAEIAGLVAEGAAGASILAVASAALTPVLIGIAILNANDTDRRLAGQQAIGYTLTAWAFGDSIPPFPSTLRASNSQFPGKQVLPRLEGAWTESATATVRNLEAEVIKKKKHKESYQVFWRAMAGDQRKKLARLVMESVAEDIEGSAQQMSFWGLNPDNYPN